MNKKANQEDYVKFKKFLRFFVKQACKNADAGQVETPTINKKNTRKLNTVRDNPKFREHYKLESGFNIIAGLDLTIRFFLMGHFGSPRSTYINRGLLNIVGEFNNKRIIALQNLIIIDNPNDEITGTLRNKCEEYNKKLKSRSIEDLGLDKDNDDPPTHSLKEMLDEYLETYNEFRELIVSLEKL